MPDRKKRLDVTAKLNDVDPQAWLADVLARIAEHPAHRIDELLPWIAEVVLAVRIVVRGEVGKGGNRSDHNGASRRGQRVDADGHDHTATRHPGAECVIEVAYRLGLFAMIARSTRLSRSRFRCDTNRQTVRSPAGVRSRTSVTVKGGGLRDAQVNIYNPVAS